MKDYNKDEETLFLQYDDANNLYGWEMFQKLRVASFELEKTHYDLAKTLQKTMIKIVIRDTCLQ